MPEENKTQSFSSRMMTLNTIVYGFGGAFPQILNFILLPVYSWLLSPSDFGILGYVSAIGAFLTITNSLSLNSYYLRYYFKSKEKKEFTGSIFYFLIITNLVFIIAEGVILNIVFRQFNVKIAFYPYMFFGLAECFFNGFSIIPLRYYRLEFKSSKYVMFIIAQVILAQGLSVYLILFHNFKAEGRLLGAALSAAIIAAFYILDSKKYAKRAINTKIIKNGLGFSLPLMIGAYSTTILSVFVRLILERFVSLSQIGIYAISFSIASLATIIVSAFSFVFEPMVYKVADSKNFIADYLRLKNYFFFLVFAIVGVLVLFSKEIVNTLLPSKFSEVANLTPIIAFSSIFIAAQNCYGLLLLLRNKTFSISMITLAAGVSSIALNLFLIPKFGVYAAALIGVFAYFISALITFVISYKEMKMPFNLLKDVLSLTVLVLMFFSTILINPLALQERILAKAFMIMAFFYFLLKNYSFSLKSLKNLLQGIIS